jgi:hypothetical protein
MRVQCLATCVRLASTQLPRRARIAAPAFREVSPAAGKGAARRVRRANSVPCGRRGPATTAQWGIHPFWTTLKWRLEQITARVSYLLLCYILLPRFEMKGSRRSSFPIPHKRADITAPVLTVAGGVTEVVSEIGLPFPYPDITAADTSGQEVAVVRLNDVNIGAVLHLGSRTVEHNNIKIPSPLFPPPYHQLQLRRDAPSLHGRALMLRATTPLLPLKLLSLTQVSLSLSCRASWSRHGKHCSPTSTQAPPLWTRWMATLPPAYRAIARS